MMYMAAVLRVEGDDPFDNLVLGIVVNYPQGHVHVAFAHELTEICEVFEDDYEFDRADLYIEAAQLQ
jgi:hypothetical protein